VKRYPELVGYHFFFGVGIIAVVGMAIVVKFVELAQELPLVDCSGAAEGGV